MNTSIIISLLPLFFLLHELEEILMVRSWIEKNGTLMHKRFPKLKRVIQVMEQMTTRKFATIAFEELFIICICTFASIQTGNLTAWYCCLAAFGIHLIVHIIQSIVWHGYIPAIISTALCLPYCLWALQNTFRFFTQHELLLYALSGTLLGATNLTAMHLIMYRRSKPDNHKPGRT